MTRIFRQFLERRRHAYRTLFMPKDGQLGPAAHIVLSDLRKFCRADSSTVQVSPVSRQIDPYASAVAEGRREVWLRIQQNLHLSDQMISSLIDQETGYENDA